MPAPGRSAIFLSLVLALNGCDDAAEQFEFGGYRYSTDAVVQWALPSRLREISGLTLDPDGRLFAHADEAAEISELDYRNGRVIRSFTLGSPPTAGDYEGIAWVEGRLYLVTSDGRLLTAEVGDDGAAMPFEQIDTGLGARCEIEGLAYHDEAHGLRLPCKVIREGRKKRTLVLTWSLEAQGAGAAGELEVVWPPDESANADRATAGDGGGRQRRLHLSGLTRARGNGNWLAVAARDDALVEFADSGEVVRAFVIPGAQGHPQMEGIAVTSDGDLIIADDGGNGRGRLSVYAAQ